jgi:N-succinyldiaminopimelate aminotransferase
MNPLLDLLQPYPFERLKQLFATVTPNPELKPISLGIGEPKHATPEIIKESMVKALNGLASYPATAGEPALRQACADWVEKRYQLKLDANTQILPVCGSREALFSFAQTVINPEQAGALVVCPNPFYQIYEGAALLAGATPYYVAANPDQNFATDWNAVPVEVWQKTQLIYVCSPGNPTGSVMQLEQWKQLFELSQKYDFVIASDECYSEIYFQDTAPLGGLQAAKALGINDFKNLVCFTSLSKRSNVPGMRSGFVAGDAQLLKKFLLFRTYHGSALSPVIQQASITAWNDEAHVELNRALYKEKFAKVTPLLAQHYDVQLPDAGFYLWMNVNGDDAEFAKALYQAFNLTVLPGSYLARDVNGVNPGKGRVRLALVATVDECLEATQRLIDFAKSRQS